jgi:K+-transporting ATPase ATPase B chain
MVGQSWFSPKLLKDALIFSLYKFDPRYAARNPVVFILYLCFIISALIAVFPSEFVDVEGTMLGRSDYVVIAIILFLTIGFSFFSEALAEAQGKAQADSLRKMKKEIIARVMGPGGAIIETSSTMLAKGDVVLLKAGDFVPSDGSIIHGSLLLDESMMTGESEPVLRESGGDRTSVLGGTKVLSGNAEVKITSEPGNTFLDRIIRLVEGAERQKTPNEIALTVLLVSLTIVLLVVVVAMVPTALYFNILLDVGVLITLFVCLMPTTIGGLLPAIGIAGVNRVTMVNVVAKSGRAVEAAGDVDVLILDKTGTITIGNRYASLFIPAPGISMDDIVKAAMKASIMDETPEGRSVILLGEKLGYRGNGALPEGATPILFTPESRTSGLIAKDGTTFIKGSVDSVAKRVKEVPNALRVQADDISRGGATPLAVAVNDEALGLIMLKDLVKPGIKDRIAELRHIGIKTIMCTGDNRLTAAAIASETGVDDFIANAIPEDKLSIIKKEQSAGRLVAMTGDGTNDAPALAQADVGLAMNNGTSAAKDAANMVDLDSDPTKLIEVVTIGKQLLITRGALTTFSVTNDVAKYFAILPAIFAPSFPALAALNIMGLSSPRNAIISALIFNALVIPLLIPVAMNGVRYRSIGASSMLKRNLLVYGFGGFLSSFIGIKLIDMLISWLVGI